MKARLIEQYDLTLTKPEMGELMLALRVFVREFDASPRAEELLEGLEEVFQGGGDGKGVWPHNDEGDGGTAVAGEEPT